VKNCSLSKVNVVHGANNARKTVRRLRDGDRQWHCISRAVIGDPQFKVSGLGLQNVAKSERGTVREWDPLSPIWSLELHERYWIRSGNTNYIKKCTPSIRECLYINSMVTSCLWSINDINGSNAVPGYCAWNVGESELPD
jgi:hypothetical protein